ncbi:MAG TPA: DUF2269 family protein [Gammaproteobacteria bacterium]|nr:DUF2269 family protein [Gammaproteobacteria bacterium]
MYLAFKLLHVVAVILFFGNVVTGVFWKHLADGSHDPTLIAHTLRAIIRLDRWLTVPSVVGIAVFGVATALAGHLPMLRTGWIAASILLFTASGILFHTLARLQRELLALAETGATSDFMDWDAYRRLSRRWFNWGLAATLLPAAALVLMVLKPF